MKRFSLRITDELDKRLEKEAKLKGVSKNSLIINVLWKNFKTPQQQRKG